MNCVCINIKEGCLYSDGDIECVCITYVHVVEAAYGLFQNEIFYNSSFRHLEECPRLCIFEALVGSEWVSRPKWDSEIFQK